MKRSTHPDPARLRDLLGASALDARPHLFADAGLTLPRAVEAEVVSFARALDEALHAPGIERALALPEPPQSPRADGVCIALDFHVDAAGPHLIEINSNAGGWLLVLAAARAASWPESEVAAAEVAFLGQFDVAWAEAGRATALESIVVVDREPGAQFLAPEFERFVSLARARGLRARIADTTALKVDASGAWVDNERFDLVYWRDTDFELASPDCASLRAAWLEGRIVLSPDPVTFARYARKTNLTLLCDAARLQAAGLSPALASAISARVPETRVVRPEDADTFWATRAEWFFKPSAGFGSRGAYRGDKITRRAFADVVAGHSVAQRLVSPPRREATDAHGSLKWDLRAFVQRGRVLAWMCRLYEGQTTNLRTPGGGIGLVTFED